MSDSGNGTTPPKAEQSDPAGEEPTEQDSTPTVTVTQLANTGEGCWKLLSDGQRIKLNDDEWRKELARLFSRDLAQS
jgi:hypothetical protein